MRWARKTLASEARAAGIGVRSGREVTLTLAPAEAGTGLRIVRSDVGRGWPLSIDAVVPAPTCTAVGDSEYSVMFVEHLLAALWAEQITDALISVDGPEIPLFDGSARPLLELLRSARAVFLPGEVATLRPTQPLSVSEGARCLTVAPATEASYSYALDHPHPLVGRQTALFRPGAERFDELARARTWALEAELRHALAAGLLRAGSEANCLVIYDDHYSDEPRSGEFAAHKLVDLIGDLYLTGRPILGAVTATRTGHADNHRMAARLLACAEDS